MGLHSNGDDMPPENRMSPLDNLVKIGRCSLRPVLRLK